jgi:hypothetical protein
MAKRHLGVERITRQRLLEALDYDGETGAFRWKKSGRAAGGLGSRGYVAIKIDQVVHFAARLAWQYVHGTTPRYIDHINGNKIDNRLSNLRECSNAENIRNQRIHSNNSSGYKGVYWHKACQKWVAQIGVDRKIHSLGVFDTAENAAIAYDAAAKSHHGEFAKLNHVLHRAAPSAL